MRAGEGAKAKLSKDLQRILKQVFCLQKWYAPNKDMLF